jgi:hypothetical protein
MLVHMLYRGTVTHKLEGDLTLDAMAVSVSSKLPQQHTARAYHHTDTGFCRWNYYFRLGGWNLTNEWFQMSTGEEVGKGTKQRVP